MFNKLAVAVLILCVAGIYAYWDQVRTPPAVSQLMAPDAAFIALDGAAHRLSDFRGKVAVVNFWATWCPPCVAEFPSLLKLAQQNPDQVVLIALSVDETADVIAPFIKKHKLNAKLENVFIAHDPDKAISKNLFKTVMYPETYIIAQDGRIERKIAGVIDWTGEDIEALIDRLAPPKD